MAKGTRPTTGGGSMGGRGASSGKTWSDSQSRKAMNDVFKSAFKLAEAVEKRVQASENGLPITDWAAYEKIVQAEQDAKQAWEAKRNLFFQKATDAVYEEYPRESERNNREMQEKIRKKYDRWKRPAPPNWNTWNIL